MNIYLILILSTLLATGKALFCKALGTGQYSKKETAVLNFKALLVAFACSLLFVADEIYMLLEISAFSIILAIFFGISVAITQIMQSKAMGNGPASLVSLVYSCGFLVPIFYGLLFWDEGVSVYQWLGILLLVVALCLIVCKGEKSGRMVAWLPVAVLAMLGSGANAIFQKTHQYSRFADELQLFLVYSLLFSSLFTGIVSLIIRKNRDKEPDLSKKQKIIKRVIVPLCLGICVGLLNFLNLSLSGKLPSVILFPVYNVGSMLLSSLISSLIYKDKPTRRQGIGFAIGIVAIMIVGIF
ncbi:MAG: EamA family transporter [Clostridia bacterium]|nr:EamA family transporter [Clostridia bacterium]